MSDVGAGDQEHEAHRAGEHHERGARAAHQHLADRLDAQALVVAQRVGVRLQELLPRRRHARAGLGERHAVGQPTDRIEVVGVVGAAGLEREGQEDLGRVAERVDVEVEVAQHAHDLVRLAAERHRAADDGRVALEPRRPEGVGEDDAGPRVREILGGDERPPDRERRAEAAEELGADPGRAKLFGKGSAGVVDDTRCIGRGVFDGSGLLLEVMELGR